MHGRVPVKAVVLTTLLGGVLVLASACGGVSQEDYDAVNTQLTAAQQQVTTKEQEAVAAKQQVASLQQQLKPPAPQEPKRLEAKITIEMGETPSDMFFATPEGVKGGPFRLPAGKTVGIQFVNKGEKLHEFMIGRTLAMESGKMHGYEVNLLEKVTADVFIYPSGSKIEVGGAEFEEAEVGPGAELWIRTTIPAELKGEWEIACFVQEPGEKGHYEQGMKAKLIIE